MDETCCFRESLKTKAIPPPLTLGPPEERGKERTEYPGEARSAILASSPAGRSQVSVDDVDVVVKNERGDVGSSPRRANGSCVKETDKERVFS